MTLSFIVAMDKNRVIGYENRMPWHLPAELKYFKQVTMGHPIIMGRKTYESIGRPLPGRTNIVLTQNPNYAVEGCLVMHSVEEVLAFEKKHARSMVEIESNDEIFVIGGAKLFEQLINHAGKLYVTKIEHAFEGDTFFSEIDEQSWRLISQKPGVTDDKNPYIYHYLVYERK